MSQPETPPRFHLALTWLQRAAAWLGIAIFAAGLGLFAYTGTYSRYWADDYCYAGVANASGLIQGSLEWYRDSGNRFSAFLLVGVSEWFGPHAISVLPALTLLLWVVAWVVFLTQALRLVRVQIAPHWLALTALILVYFNVLLAPDRLQTIYWRMGTLHYTLPLPLLLLNLGLLAGCLCAQRSWRDVLVGGSRALLAFFAAGLSETFAAMQAGLFALLLLGAWVAWRGAPRRRALALLGALLFGALLAMGVEMRSPSNAWRQAALPPPASLVQLIFYTLRYSLDFLRDSLRGQPLPLLAMALSLGSVAFLALRKESPFTFNARGRLLGMGLSLALGFGLVVCSFAPSAFAGLQFPAGRALMPARFAFLVGLAGLVFFAADWARALLGQRAILAALAAAVLLAASLYPLRMVDLNRREIATLAVRAGRWDQRDAQIRQALSSGVRDVRVQQTDVVQTLEDIGPDANFWINRCAALYYHAGSVTAKP